MTAPCLKIFGIVFLARLPCGDRAGRRGGQWNRNLGRAMVPVVVAAVLTVVSAQTRSQSLSSSGDSSANAGVIFAEKPDYLTYVRPMPTAMLKHYAFDAFGPYALAFTAFTAGFDQATNTPPEWKQGFGGYAERFGSDFGIAAVGTTARYGTAAAFRDDTSYYRCECRGLSALGPRGVLDLNGAPWTRWPSGNLFPRVGRPLRRFDGGRLWLVPQPLRSQGCTPWATTVCLNLPART